MGRIAWSGDILHLPAAMIFPALWAFAPSRRVAAIVSAAYFLAASRGLPEGVANFYAADLWPASCSGLPPRPPLSLCMQWRGQDVPGGGGAVRYLAAAMLMAVPPFGITGWAHPLTAAGVLFPGWR